MSTTGYTQNNSHDATVNDTERAIRMSRSQFSNNIKIGGNNICCAVDRSAVLDVYDEALRRINTCDRDRDRIQIASETNRKVKVILQKLDVEPDDIVFSTVGQILKPLEPQYANPRIEWEKDEYGYRTQWRITAWRKDGWPHEYPRNAIWAELHGNEKLVGRSRMSDREIRERMNEEDKWEAGVCLHSIHVPEYVVAVRGNGQSENGDKIEDLNDYDGIGIENDD
ncbi:hypothetical protein GQ44DRAFT_778094 [Phaeosphaeriaceae sp. PMI808]|nr:hypothetical protein GQ44DRAFT_778094 [Phaeosphaeriaceae sp. PMI808]